MIKLLKPIHILNKFLNSLFSGVRTFKLYAHKAIFNNSKKIKSKTLKNKARKESQIYQHKIKN